jgi:hypothetical protein
VEVSSSAVKGAVREERAAGVREGRVTEERKEEQSDEEKEGAAHKAVKYC